MRPSLLRNVRFWRPLQDEREIRFRLSEQDEIFNTLRRVRPHDNVRIEYPPGEEGGYFIIDSADALDKTVSALRKSRRLREETE